MADSNTLRQRLHHQLSTEGAQPFIEFKGRWHSWAEVYADWQAVQGLLDAAGVPPDAALGFVARTRVQHAAVILGAFATGRMLTMIYPFQAPSVIARDIAGIKVAAVIADRQDWTPEAIAAAREAGSAGIMIANVTDGAAPRVSIVPGLERAGAGPHRSMGERHDIEVLSSGTTGVPKRIRLPVQALMRAVTSITLGADSAQMSAEERKVEVLFNPFGNIGGVMAITAGAYLAKRIVLLEKFALNECVEAIRNHRITTLGASPPVIRQILEAQVPRADLASLEMVFGGSGPLSAETQQRFEEAYGIPILWGYGATEFAGTVVTWTPALRKEFGGRKPGSIGRALVGARVRMVDPATGAEVPRGEPGNLEAQVDILGPQWIRTNDLGLMDEDGFVFLHGRADGAINRGGFKVLPERVVDALRQHPAVRDAAVVGLPDNILGEVPVAALERRGGMPDPSAGELEKLVRDRLPAPHVPKRFLMVDELPRTPSLKVRLGEVRKLFE